MKYLLSNLVLLLFILTAGVLHSSADVKKGEQDYHHLTPYSGTPEFEMMKNLLGT